MPLIYVFTISSLSSLNSVLGTETSCAINVSLFETRQVQEIFPFQGSSRLPLESRSSISGDKAMFSLYFFVACEGTTSLYSYNAETLNIRT